MRARTRRGWRGQAWRSSGRQVRREVDRDPRPLCQSGAQKPEAEPEQNVQSRRSSENAASSRGARRHAPRGVAVRGGPRRRPRADRRSRCPAPRSARRITGHGQGVRCGGAGGWLRERRVVECALTAGRRYYARHSGRSSSTRGSSDAGATRPLRIEAAHSRRRAPRRARPGSAETIARARQFVVLYSISARHERLHLPVRRAGLRTGTLQRTYWALETSPVD
jgi:hypothetical protein